MRTRWRPIWRPSSGHYAVLEIQEADGRWVVWSRSWSKATWLEKQLEMG